VTIPRSAGSTSLTALVAAGVTTRDNFTIASKQAFDEVIDGYQAATGAPWTPGDEWTVSTGIVYNHSKVASTT
jgi:roadblock/LC7 domain-containing protein